MYSEPERHSQPAFFLKLYPVWHRGSCQTPVSAPLFLRHDSVDNQKTHRPGHSLSLSAADGATLTWTESSLTREEREPGLLCRRLVQVNPEPLRFQNVTRWLTLGINCFTQSNIQRAFLHCNSLRSCPDSDTDFPLRYMSSHSPVRLWRKCDFSSSLGFTGHTEAQENSQFVCLCKVEPYVQRTFEMCISHPNI